MLVRLFFGAVFVLGVVVLVAVGARVFFGREIGDEIARLTANAKSSGIAVTAEMVAALPEPAQRFFNQAQVIGKQVPRLVVVTQTGRIRNSEDANWMEFVAEETYATEPPGFVWQVWFPNKTLPVVVGRDLYMAGHSSILMKLGALYPIASDFRPALGEAGLMRYLNEMMWFPAAFFTPGVTISPDTDNSFRATLESDGLTASAILVIDDEGRLVNFRAERFNTGTDRMETWETPMSDFGTFEGIDMPISGAAVWKLPDGDFTYIELTLTGVRYRD